MDIKNLNELIKNRRGEMMAKLLESFSKEQLIKRIKDLESQLEYQFKEYDQEFFVNFPWAGNLGQWYWNYTTNKVTFNDKKVMTLGYSTKDIGEIGFEFFTEKLHPDDYDHVMQNMRDHLMGKIDAYEVEYRIRHKDGHYLWYYDRGVVTQRDKDGKPMILQGIVFDISETKKIEERLRYLSERDVLTHFYNRRLFFEHIGFLVNKQKNTFSLIMFDIDHFKLINDRYGHLVGDDVLRSISKTVIQMLTQKDKAYRYGGEEFFIILKDTLKKEALEISENLRKEIEEIKCSPVDKVTVSIGVVEHQPNETIDDVVKRVDDLLYDAKRAGRNRVKS